MFPIAQRQHNMGQMITSTSARTVVKSALTKSAAAAAYCSVSLRRDFSATRDCVCESSMRRWIGWPRIEKTRSVSASAFVSTSSSNSSMEKRATKASGSHSDRKRNVINNNMNSSNQQQQQQQQRANQQKVRAVLEPEQSSQRRQDQQIAANNNNNNNDFNNDNQMKKSRKSSKPHQLPKQPSTTLKTIKNHVFLARTTEPIHANPMRHLIHLGRNRTRLCNDFCDAYSRKSSH